MQLSCILDFYKHNQNQGKILFVMGLKCPILADKVKQHKLYVKCAIVYICSD